MAVTPTLYLKPSNDLVFPVQLDTGDPAEDWAGYSCQLMLKRDLNDPDSAAIIHDTKTVDTGGYCEFYLTKAQTIQFKDGLIYYDLRVIDSDGYAGNSDVGTIEVLKVVNHGQGA